MKRVPAVARIWSVCCSLKLAIILASAATAVIMGGSLLMPFNPRIFSGMDELHLGAWLAAAWSQAPAQVWWVPAAGLLLLLLGLNTLCCFADWIVRFRARWRKSGEYLIHLGFILVLAAYLWGSVAGFRSQGHRVFVGQTVPLPIAGLYLKLETFEPVFNAAGRPVDMINSLVLLEGDRVVSRALARTNHPLTWNGLVILPASYGQAPVASRLGRSGGYRTYSILTVNYDPGARLALAGGVAMGIGVLLAMISFYRKRARNERPEIL